ncbi:MAG: TIR domain-containing protein [Prevotellaceae bacterium]|jgi:CheY-like chemotaxis protein|nr:TIR domain-containing protein [Prevotellaceae bacterium]
MKEQKVFISYSHTSRPFADLVKLKLQEKGIDVWDDSQIAGGEEWKETIDIAIDNSSVIVCLLDNNSVKSQYVTYEWAYALGRGKHIIPILEGNIDLLNVHPKLQAKQCLDFRQDYNLKWNILIESIHNIFNINQSVETINNKKDTILWVDDRPSNNIYERSVFEGMGLKFDLALSTNEALALLNSSKYVAIISDMGRVEGPNEGYVLLKEVRRKDKQTPFFIYAASNLPEHKILALSKGAQGSTNSFRELIDLVTAHIY